MRAGGGVGWGLSRGELREASRKASHRHDEWLAQLEGRYRTIWWQRNKCESAALYLSHDQPGDGAIGGPFKYMLHCHPTLHLADTC